MKFIYFESIGGGSGDMILGSLISLGANIRELNKELKNIIPNESFEIVQISEMRDGITGVKTQVKIYQESHKHRHFSDIKKIIQLSNLPEFVKNLSLKTFALIAEAEGKVHGKPPDKVHFHEVGAVDSIVDIIGSALAIYKLGIEKILIKTLPIGCGTVKCAHGIIPVPAPATIEILKDFPVNQTDEPYELVTPTAAALFCAFDKVNKSSMSIKKTSYSYGHRKLNNRPNLLRASICETTESSKTCYIFETNIDDTTPEIIAYVFDKLLQNGALDVWTSSIQMKKQRMGCLLTVLCEEKNKELLKIIVFQETTTIGIREYSVERTVLQREIEYKKTDLGDIRVKKSYLHNELITESPEIDDCIKIAKKKKMPLKTVLSQI